MSEFQPGWVILIGPTFCNYERKSYIDNAVKKNCYFGEFFQIYQPFCLMFKHELCIVRVTKNRQSVI